MKIRIAKFIADSGAASRREAERLIECGAVKVNGARVDTPVFFVQNGDRVEINGRPVTARDKTRVFVFNKPINTVTSAHDPDGRKTIYDVLPVALRNLKYVGRLDYKTTGLLLLTDAGEFARKLTLPSTGILRTYVAKLRPMDMGEIKSAASSRALRQFLSPLSSDAAIFDTVRRGVTVDGIKYAPMQIELLTRYPLAVKITLTEGKKNEIRIIMRHLGFMVSKLHRESYGPIKLDGLKSGEVRELSASEIVQLLGSGLIKL